MSSEVPKRIILSRKGWDSRAGGRPSPILPDGTLGTLPIPDEGSNIRYRDLLLPDGRCMGPVVENLSRGRITADTEVHLDPDLRANCMKRAPFQAAFGQCGRSQSYLENQAVGSPGPSGPDDLFLFFGLYRPVDDTAAGWRYRKDHPAIHVIFGWLQVGEVVNLADRNAPPDLQRHPHAIPSQIVRNELRTMKRNNNTLYVARTKLSFRAGTAGAGTFGPFSYDDPDDWRRLTKPNQRHASLWRLPSFFKTLSNMGDQPGPEGRWWYPQRRGPGQEFVLDVNGNEAEAANWLKRLFTAETRSMMASAG